MTAATTKKLLVAFDPKRPTAIGNDFLVPIVHEGEVVLRGLRSKRNQEYGLTVYTGRSVGAADLFTRCVDSGTVIESDDVQMELADEYIKAVKSARIGTVYRLSVEGTSIELEKTSLRATGSPRKLP